jgi:hypothetical protein
VLPVYIDSEAPVQAELVVEGDAGAAIVEVITGLRSAEGKPNGGMLADYLNETKLAQLNASLNGWTVTLGTDTSDVAGGAAESGGRAIQITHATTPMTGLRRVRLTRTTKLDSLRGKWDVWVRLAGDSLQYWYPQLRWGLGTPDPAPFVEDEVGPLAIVGGYLLKKLGRIRVPERPANIGGLTLELWTRKINAGGANLYGDYLFLVPADEGEGILKVPTGLTAVAVGEQMHSSPDLLGVTEKTDPNENHQFLLDVEGTTPLELPPGLSVVALKFGTTIAANTTRPVDTLARTPIVSVRYAPRFYS